MCLRRHFRRTPCPLFHDHRSRPRFQGRSRTRPRPVTHTEPESRRRSFPHNVPQPPAALRQPPALPESSPQEVRRSWSGARFLRCSSWRIRTLCERWQQPSAMWFPPGPRRLTNLPPKGGSDSLASRTSPGRRPQARAAQAPRRRAMSTGSGTCCPMPAAASCRTPPSSWPRARHLIRGLPPTEQVTSALFQAEHGHHRRHRRTE